MTPLHYSFPSRLPLPSDEIGEVLLAHPQQPADVVDSNFPMLDVPTYRLGRHAKPSCDGGDVEQWIGGG
jgi:hypothetical protein